MKTLIVSLSLLSAALATADEIPEGDFQTEQLYATPEASYIISSFDEIDYFTTFSNEGKPLWEIPFASKIQSWKISGDSLLIFSKRRDGRAYFLSCVQLDSGQLRWEKPIFPPAPPEEKPSEGEMP